MSEIGKALRKWRTKFDPERQLKCRLASFFWSDANDFLWRVDLVQRSDMQHRSFFAKLFVDLLMAAECSMKSIIFSMSPTSETPEQAYRVARNCSHDLMKLATQASVRCKGRVRFLTAKQLKILQRAANLGVRTRYSADVFFMLDHEDFLERLVGSGKVSATLEDDEWLNQFYRVVARAFKAARDASDKECKKHTVIFGSDSSNWSKRVKGFLQASGIKP